MLEKVKNPTVELSEFDAASRVVIKPPNFQETIVHIRGTAPFVMNRMSSENREKIITKQMEGNTSRKGRGVLPPKNFEKIYRGCMHVSTDGWYGIPAAAFRNAMISACKMVGWQMTRAKQAFFIVHDGTDREDSQPLVRITGQPVRRDMPVKLADGSTDIIPRAFFEEWSARLRVRWNADHFRAQDMINLLSHAGISVGVGAGRPDSKNSAGMGWGTFMLVDSDEGEKQGRRKSKQA